MGGFRTVSGQIVGQKIEKFPIFMQNNEKTTVFKVLSLKNGRFLVEVTGLEPAASCSQRNPEYLFPLISGHFRPFPLGNTSFPALLSPLFPRAPVV